MARIRSMKPEFWSDQDITRLSRDVRLLYIALWNFADEEARMPGDPRLVKSWCFPLDDDVTATTVDEWLDQLEQAGKVLRYEIDGGKYLLLRNLGSHQKLDARLTSRYPAPPAETRPTPVHTDQSGRTGVPNAGPHQPEGAKQVAGSREHVAGSRGRDARAGARGDTPGKGTRLPDDWQPSPADLAWAQAERLPDDWVTRATESFRDYWHGVPGGKGRKADWSATWRNWLRKDAERLPSRASPPSQSRNAQILAAAMQRAEQADRRTG